MMDEQPFFILLFDLIIIPPFHHSNLFALRSLYYCFAKSLNFVRHFS